MFNYQIPLFLILHWTCWLLHLWKNGKKRPKRPKETKIPFNWNFSLGLTTLLVVRKLVQKSVDMAWKAVEMALWRIETQLFEFIFYDRNYNIFGTHGQFSCNIACEEEVIGESIILDPLKHYILLSNHAEKINGSCSIIEVKSLWASSIFS